MIEHKKLRPGVTAHWDRTKVAPTEFELQRALDTFATHWPSVMPVLISDIHDAYMGTNIFVHRELYRSGGRYHGLQSGRDIHVEWKDGPCVNALFHELVHMIDELVLGEVDVEHTDRTKWNGIALLRDQYGCVMP